MDDDYSFADIMKFLRERQGLSARRLSIMAGLSPSYMSKLECERLIPSVDIFNKLVENIGCSDSEILFLIRICRSLQ